MHIFLATPQAWRTEKRTGNIYPRYRESLQQDVDFLSRLGHLVACPTLDQEFTKPADPGKFLETQLDEVDKAEGLLAYVDPVVSARVQTLVGYALGAGKAVTLASSPLFTELGPLNTALIDAGRVHTIPLPLDTDPFPAA